MKGEDIGRNPTMKIRMRRPFSRRSLRE